MKFKPGLASSGSNHGASCYFICSNAVRWFDRYYGIKEVMTLKLYRM